MNKQPEPNRGFLRYFVTQAGRKLVFGTAAAATLGLFIGHYAPQTFGLKYYRDFVQSYQNGIARPVSERLLDRFEKAMEKLELADYERRIIKPFTAFGFDLVQAGSTKSRFGGVLGIPINYNYSDMGQANRNEIRFRNHQIDWNSESGKLMENALILNEDEQIFGLCKSILQLQTHHVLFRSMFPSISFLMVYTVGSYLNKRLNLFVRPLGLRFVMYSILGCFGVGSWSFLNDYYQVTQDADIDKHLSNLGPEMVQAGCTYYDKQLKKNMALRALLGNDKYTAKGNVNYFLRQESMPLTMRRSFFEEKWKELNAPSTGNSQ